MCTLVLTVTTDMQHAGMAGGEDTSIRHAGNYVVSNMDLDMECQCLLKNFCVLDLCLS